MRRTWLNTAHQGLLSPRAGAAAREAVRWKEEPWELTQERFDGVPRRLRAALGRLVGCPADDIVLGNSNSYGLHLLANGIRWQPGDEVLLVRGDFPSTVLPWQELAGVAVRWIDPGPEGLTAAQVERAIEESPRPRLLATTWVHSFTGRAIDERSVGEVCRRHGVLFVLNGSQGVGARTLDIGAAPVDALTSVGFKWLRGPYGTGFAWLRPELREALDYNQVYWLAQQTAAGLAGATSGGGGDPAPASGLGARKYDVFGTANFFNFTAWTAALEEHLEAGVEAAAAHDQGLVERLVGGLEAAGYRLASPRRGPARSTLVLFSHPDPAENEPLYERLRAEGLYLALRRGLLRASPHVHNSAADVDRLLAALGG